MVSKSIIYTVMSMSKQNWNRNFFPLLLLTEILVKMGEKKTFPLNGKK